MGKNLQTWSIIIFTYNEAESLNQVIEKCLKVLELLNPSHSELIIVDDGSTDTTKKNLQLYLCNPAITVISHEINKGIGEALLSGYRSACYENICALPGDGQFDPYELVKYAEFSSDNYISFYRKNKKYTPYRHILTKANKLFNRLFLNLELKDVNWVKIYKKKHFSFVEPKLSSMMVESEICATLNSANIKAIEVVSICQSRKHGHSKAGSYKTLIRVLYDIIKLLKIKISRCI